MRHNRLDLNLLVALDALLEECSVSRAADRVFITQSAMSNALGRLRRHFNDDLVTQVGRRMVRTEKGEVLQPEIRAILLRIADATRPVDDFEPGSATRTFRIACSDYFCSVALPALIQHLSAHAPGVYLDVLPLSPKLHEELERGEVDLLIVPTIYTVRKASSQLLFKDRWVCLAWKKNEELDDRLSLTRFLELEHVAKRMTHPSSPSLEEREFVARKIKRRIAARVPNYDLLPLAVLGTSRIATVQYRLAAMWADWLPLAIHKLPFRTEPLLEAMEWHGSRENDKGQAWFRKTVAAVCKGLDT